MVKGGDYVYNTSAIPPAATGLVITATLPMWVNSMFLFAAVFAIIGAIFALKRTLPIPAFEHKMRLKSLEKNLKNRP